MSCYLANSQGELAFKNHEFTKQRGYKASSRFVFELILAGNRQINLRDFSYLSHYIYNKV